MEYIKSSQLSEKPNELLYKPVRDSDTSQKIKKWPVNVRLLNVISHTRNAS